MLATFRLAAKIASLSFGSNSLAAGASYTAFSKPSVFLPGLHMYRGDQDSDIQLYRVMITASLCKYVQLHPF